ncbi:MAG: hypothetical protein KQH79_07115 [Bacteroidetes bacterium]|nr:hypothetical protein [Bacteroidota bacterium]
MNKYFSLKRFSHLLKREIHINIKRDLLIIGAMYSLFTLVIFLVFEFSEEVYNEKFFEEFHFVTYIIMLFVGSVFITSFSFIELRDKLKSHFYLLTPGSNFEKFLVNILISFLGYALFMLISYLIYSSIFNWITWELYQLPFKPLNIASSDFLLVMQIYIIAHSVFFLGAITFKKYPLVLTPIAGFILLTLFSVINNIMAKLILSDMSADNQFDNMGLSEFFLGYEGLAKATVFYVGPLILWFIAYLKLNEKEH